MISVALALSVFAASADAGPELHLVPSLALESAAAPDLAPPLQVVAPERAGHPALSAGVMMALVDVPFLLLVFVGTVPCLVTGECSALNSVSGIGLAGWLLVSPAMGVSGARASLGDGGSAARAYGAAVGVRLAVAGLVAAARVVALPALLAANVLAPWLIAEVLETTAPAREPRATAGALALPVRDPALATR